ELPHQIGQGPKLWQHAGLARHTRAPISDQGMHEGGDGCARLWADPTCGLRFASLLQHASATSLLKNSNVIARIMRSYNPQTVVCGLYGKRDCLLAGFNATAAALWPRD